MLMNGKVLSGGTTLAARKVVFYNPAHVPSMPGGMLKRFETRTRTDWHYECASAFRDGTVTAD